MLEPVAAMCAEGALRAVVTRSRPQGLAGRADPGAPAQEDCEGCCERGATDPLTSLAGWREEGGGGAAGRSGLGRIGAGFGFIRTSFCGKLALLSGAALPYMKDVLILTRVMAGF